MAFPAAVAGPWLCFLLLLGVPLTLGATLLGGKQNVPVSDPEVQKAAQVAVKTFNDRNNCMYYSQVLQVLSAQRQAVAGPWLCFLLLLGVPLTLGATLLGGKQNVPVSDPEVQKAAQVAVKTFNDRNNCMYYSQVLQVLSAQRQ
ncbi:unnamed protein product, partial [Eretmochelys imbricata]